MGCVRKFQADVTTYSPVELRAALDSFREPLFKHLDEEVYVLGFVGEIELLLMYPVFLGGTCQERT